MDNTGRRRVAALLWIGALLVAGAGNAAITVNTRYFAQELLTTTGVIEVKDGGKYFTATFPATTNFDWLISLRTVPDIPTYARIDFENMVLPNPGSQIQPVVANIAGGCPGNNTNTVDFVARRNEGRSVVFSIRPTPIHSVWCIRYPMGSESVGVRSGNVKAKVTLYVNLRDALYGTEDQLLLETKTNTLAVVESVLAGSTVTAKPEVTASVAKGFATFTTGPTATLADVTVAAAHTKTATDGTSIAYYDPTDPSTALTASAAKNIVKDATVTFDGDFSLGAFTLSGAAACPDEGALAINDAKNELVGTMTDVGTCQFKMDVSANAKAESDDDAETNYTPIKEQRITADLAVTLSTEKPAYPFTTRIDLPAGEIVRDGTTVQLPYLITARGYSQQLVIANRSMKDAEFWLDDLISDGTNPTNLVPPAVPKIVAKGSLMTLDVGDLVDLGENATKGTATLAVNALSTDVSVMTTLNNLATGVITTVVAHEPIRR